MNSHYTHWVNAPSPPVIETLIAEARRKDHEIDRLRELVDELLNRVTALEGRQDNPIEIPDSPAPLPVRIQIDDAH